MIENTGLTLWKNEAPQKPFRYPVGEASWVAGEGQCRMSSEFEHTKPFNASPVSHAQAHAFPTIMIAHLMQYTGPTHMS